jgi:hypothetical protein
MQSLSVRTSRCVLLRVIFILTPKQESEGERAPLSCEHLFVIFRITRHHQKCHRMWEKFYIFYCTGRGTPIILKIKTLSRISSLKKLKEIFLVCTYVFLVPSVAYKVHPHTFSTAVCFGQPQRLFKLNFNTSPSQ